jgi:hypothetical protein
VLLELQMYAATLRETTRARLESAGLPASQGELHQLLRALIEDGTAGPC